MLKSNTVVLYNRVYIPKDLIININLFKKAFTRVVNEEFHVLFKYHSAKDIYSVGIGDYHIAAQFLKYHEVVDSRLEVPTDIRFSFIGTLRPEQDDVMGRWISSKETSGTLVARAGGGKTCMMAWLIANMQQKTIILVPTDRILSQWKTAIYEFLGVIPAVIGGGKFAIGDITVASYKSLTSAKGKKRLQEVHDNFGMVIIDEAHKSCARAWRELIHSFPAKHKVGCTATRKRKDKTIFHLDSMVGRHIVEMTKDDAEKALVKIIRTSESFPFYQPNEYIKALDSISKNRVLNTIVAKRIMADYIRGRFIVVLSPRIAQLEMIGEILDTFDIPNGRLVSEVNANDTVVNSMLLEEVRDNNWVLLATDALVGTGFDESKLDCLHLPYSYNNEGNFEQYVGRIERKLDGKPKPEFNHYFFKDKGMSQYQQTNMLGTYARLGYDIVVENDELQSDDKTKNIKTSNWNC